MSEWPKAVGTDYLEDWLDEAGPSAGDWILVIPADLGRELYEALKAVQVAGAPSFEIWADKAWDELPRIAQLTARYEREVGE